MVHMNSATALSIVDEHADAVFAEKVLRHVAAFTKRKIRVILIADGETRQPTKMATLQRSRARAAYLHAAQKARSDGDEELAKKLLKKSVCITRSMLQAIEASCRNDPYLSYYKSPYEFDHQAAYMLKQSEIDAVYSADSDLLALGCRMLIRSIDNKSGTITVATSTHSAVSTLRRLAAIVSAPSTAAQFAPTPASSQAATQHNIDEEYDDNDNNHNKEGNDDDDDDNNNNVAANDNTIRSLLFDSETTTPEHRAYLACILGNDYLPSGVERLTPRKLANGELGNRSPRQYVEHMFSNDNSNLRAFAAAAQTFLYTPVFTKDNNTLTYLFGRPTSTLHQACAALAIDENVAYEKRKKDEECHVCGQVWVETFPPDWLWYYCEVDDCCDEHAYCEGCFEYHKEELRELRRRSAIRNVVVNSFRQAIITVIVPVLPINERIQLTDLLEYLPEFERAELLVPDLFNYVGPSDLTQFTDVTHAGAAQLSDFLATFGYAQPHGVGIDLDDMRRIVCLLARRPPQLFDQSGAIEKARALRDVRNNRVARRERLFAFEQPQVRHALLRRLYSHDLLDTLAAADRLLLLEIVVQFLIPCRATSTPTQMSQIVYDSLHYMRVESGIDRLARCGERAVVDSLHSMAASMMAAFVDDAHANQDQRHDDAAYPPVPARLLCVEALVLPSMRALGVGADDEKGYHTRLCIDKHGLCGFACQCVAGKGGCIHIAALLFHIDLAVNRSGNSFALFVFESIINRDGDSDSAVLDEAARLLFPKESDEARSARRQACTDSQPVWRSFPYDRKVGHTAVKFLTVVAPHTERHRVVAGDSDAKRFVWQAEYFSKWSYWNPFPESFRDDLFDHDRLFRELYAMGQLYTELVITPLLFLRAKSYQQFEVNAQRNRADAKIDDDDDGDNNNGGNNVATNANVTNNTNNNANNDDDDHNDKSDTFCCESKRRQCKSNNNDDIATAICSVCNERMHQECGAATNDNLRYCSSNACVATCTLVSIQTNNNNSNNNTMPPTTLSTESTSATPTIVTRRTSQSQQSVASAKKSSKRKSAADAQQQQDDNDDDKANNKKKRGARTHICAICGVRSSNEADFQRIPQHSVAKNEQQKKEADDRRRLWCRYASLPIDAVDGTRICKRHIDPATDLPYTFGRSSSNPVVLQQQPLPVARAHTLAMRAPIDAKDARIIELEEQLRVVTDALARVTLAQSASIASPLSTSSSTSTSTPTTTTLNTARRFATVKHDDRRIRNDTGFLSAEHMLCFFHGFLLNYTPPETLVLRRRPTARPRANAGNDDVSDDEDANDEQNEAMMMRNSLRAQRRLDRHWRKQRELVDVAARGIFQRIETTPDGTCQEATVAWLLQSAQLSNDNAATVKHNALNIIRRTTADDIIATNLVEDPQDAMGLNDDDDVDWDAAREKVKADYIALHERNNESGDDLMLVAMMKHYNVNLMQYVVDEQSKQLMDATVMHQRYFVDNQTTLQFVYFAGPNDIRNGHYEPLRAIDNNDNNNNDNNNSALNNNNNSTNINIVENKFEIDDDTNNDNDLEKVNHNPPQPPPLPAARVAQPIFRLANRGRPRSIALIDEFYVYCMYMYLQVSLEWLAGEFCISISYASAIVKVWSRIEYRRHEAFGRPTKKEIEKMCDDESVKIRGLPVVKIDTTDVAIETPKNRQLGKLLYSNYYGGYRLKALIVLTFEGYVYSGDLFSGGVSDNTMLQQSGVIGDFDGMVVVTDKGFRSEAFGREINTVMCHAAIREGGQMTGVQTLHTAFIASIRGDSERAVRRVKRWGCVRRGVSLSQNLLLYDTLFKNCVSRCNFVYRSLTLSIKPLADAMQNAHTKMHC